MAMLLHLLPVTRPPRRTLLDPQHDPSRLRTTVAKIAGPSPVPEHEHRVARQGGAACPAHHKSRFHRGERPTWAARPPSVEPGLRPRDSWFAFR